MAAPWLLMPPGWDALAVDAQAGSADSMLAFYKRVLALRRALVGTLPNGLEWRPSPEGTLVYERGPLSVAVNFLARQVEVPARGRLLIGSHPLVRHRDGKLGLPANSGAWLDGGGGL
jgi:alpha-glucosidase